MPSSDWCSFLKKQIELACFDDLLQLMHKGIAHAMFYMLLLTIFLNATGLFSFSFLADVNSFL